ncbi:DNA processing protein [Alkalithermobacter thermoalcaliphilus JW-YL-7 = DSM 7308]|uniref:DNA processing protein n=1 Tax=Alkalithermobacter thermoalcaliphilus JW-YL-7 = DSM 7308 TaxID=1121328 RepID=A0A150FSF1_CLOPD|nr:DNA protecting protein DprA [[Clostridium] paradoxum JW-YL-7 = DSM 7308]SHK75560.1 DNA processing protein [[Clostridium] paradoxum JW-YL-7 = DSM 7308]
MDRSDTYLLLWHIKGIGYKTIRKLEEYLDFQIENIWNINVSEIHKIPNISSKIKESIVQYRSLCYLDKIKEDLLKNNIQYITIDDDKYPKKLKNIYDPPYVIFISGNEKILDEFSIAMVGSRKATGYGIWCAKKISEELSNLGINIVSGLAIGIDYYSHVGALNGKANTIAVLGSSIDRPYPKENIKLMRKIIENKGAVISEYPLNSMPKPAYFPMRNRIISGIADGVLVVEAAQKSGALITVDYALEQGKNVFAIPGNINSFMSSGCNKIIKEGAKLVTSTEDIICEYDITLHKNLTDKNNLNIESDENIIISILKKYGSLHVDTILQHTNMNIKDILGILNILEIKGEVLEIGNKIYTINT